MAADRRWTPLLLRSRAAVQCDAYGCAMAGVRKSAGTAIANRSGDGRTPEIGLA